MTKYLIILTFMIMVIACGNGENKVPVKETVPATDNVQPDAVVAAVQPDDATNKSTDDCLETGEFLLTYNPKWAIKHLETCSDTPQKYAMLIRAYYLIGDYENQGRMWTKHFELTAGNTSLSSNMSSFMQCGKSTSKTLNSDLCIVVSYKETVARWPDNPYMHYFFALYTLNDPTMFGGRKISGDLLGEYFGLFGKKETACSLARKSLEKAFNFDKAKILTVPKSFTKQCGKW